MCPTNEEEKQELSTIPYRQAIESLLFLAMITRPDISYAVNVFSRSCENPGKGHWEGIKRIMGYLQGTQNYAITYGTCNEKLTAYSDADWGSDTDTRRSTIGYIMAVLSLGVANDNSFFLSHPQKLSIWLRHQQFKK